ncbi:MAG: hypothetical protein EOP11_01910 [Proteobacteria bacterium]|nr:MAG: hypothetical protein EOP11_01910 [Pseudomonadota bacterium]
MRASSARAILLKVSRNLADETCMFPFLFLSILLLGFAPPANAYDWERFRLSENVENRIKEAENVTPEKFDAGVKRLINGLEFLQKADCTNLAWFRDGDRKPLLKKLKAAKKAVEIFALAEIKGAAPGEINSCQGAFVAQENAIRSGQLSIEQKVDLLKSHYAPSVKLAETNVKKLIAVATSPKVVKTPECAKLSDSLQNALLDYQVDYGHVYETLQASWKKLNAAADDLLAKHCSSVGESDSAGEPAPMAIRVGGKKAEAKVPADKPASKAIPVEPELQDFVSGALGPGKLEKR